MSSRSLPLAGKEEGGREQSLRGGDRLKNARHGRDHTEAREQRQTFAGTESVPFLGLRGVEFGPDGASLRGMGTDDCGAGSSLRTNARRRHLLLAAVAAGVFVTCIATATSATTKGQIASVGGDPVTESAKPGIAAWQPLSPNGRDHEIEGYASETSLTPGQSLHLHVSVKPAARYQIQIYRLGWYRGKGGRLMRCIPVCTGSLKGTTQAIPEPATETGFLRLTWPATTVLRIPTSWVTGLYVAKLVLWTNPRQWPGTGHSAVVPFIVRDPANAKPSKILVISDANTEEAYNNWGGKSLYNFNSTGGVSANHVSFDRPYAAELWFYEIRLIMFLESQRRLDLSYATDVDVQERPGELLRHKVVLVTGHNEYWSRQMRDAYEAARDRGVNLAFFGGNFGDWQIRYEDANRTLVEYRSATADPNPSEADKTVKFGQLRPPRPQCQILGTQFVDNIATLPREFRINDAALQDPWFAGTGFKAGDTFSAVAGEADIAAPEGCLPYPVTTFWTSTLQRNFAPAIRYRAASGATVFAAGSYALSLTGLTDARLRRFTVNALTSLSR